MSIDDARILAKDGADGLAAAYIVLQPWRNAGIDPAFPAETPAARRMIEFCVGRPVGDDEFSAAVCGLGDDGPRMVTIGGRDWLEWSASNVLAALALLGE